MSSIPLYAAGDSPLSHVVQHPLITKALHLEGFWEKLTSDGHITVLSDQIVMMIAAALLLGLFLPVAVRRRRDQSETGRLVPTGFGNLVETICAYLRDEVIRPVLHDHTDRFIKYLWTAFFFILTMNLLGMIPLGSWTPLAGLHIGGTPTGNIWVTATMAAVTFVLMVFNGLRFGGIEYIKHFSMGAPKVMALPMALLEVIGTFAKVAALALRLFAAIAGGHILLAVLVGLILSAGEALGMGGGLGLGLVIAAASVAISLVEVFVAFLQAFIFTFLSALFIGMSVNLHHDEDHGEGHAAGSAAH